MTCESIMVYPLLKRTGRLVVGELVYVSGNCMLFLFSANALCLTAAQGLILSVCPMVGMN